jgi:calcium/calmodulin-dependent protein kinase I
VDECKSGRIIFHERYWKDVSKDAKEFILSLLQPDPKRRTASHEALKHIWLTGTTASDHDLLPEIRSYLAKAKLKRGIELVKLANRIDALKVEEDEDPRSPDANDIPSNAQTAAGLAVKNQVRGVSPGRGLATNDASEKRHLSKVAKSAIFREVVLAKVREMKEKEKSDLLIAEVTKEHERRKSFSGQK